VRREGDGLAELAVLWVRRGNVKSGATPLLHATVVGTAEGDGRVKAVVQKPRWAEHARLVVRVGPNTTARVDDVVVEPAPAEETALPQAKAGDSDVQSRRDGGVDLVRNVTVLFAGAAPWARLPGGKVVGGPHAFEVERAEAAGGGFEVRGRLRGEGDAAAQATIAWTPTEDGVVAKVSADGAEAVGLSADMPRAQVADGVRVIAASGGRSDPAADLPAVDGVTKVLAGDPMVLLALPAEGGRLEPRPTPDAGFARWLVWRAGASAEFPFVLSFSGLEQGAARRLAAALARLETETGPAITELRALAAEFAFLQGVRDKAVQAAEARERRAVADAASLEEALGRHQVFGSRESLEEAERQARALAAQYPPAGAGGAGRLDDHVHDLARRVAQARRAYEVRRAAPEVRRLSRLAELLEAEEGYEAVAAAYWDAVARRFGGLSGEGASGPEAEEVAKKVAEAKERLKALLAKPEVAGALPTVPAPAAN
jgi:hypothetical protein